MTPTQSIDARPDRPLFPLSTVAITALLVMSTGLFLVFPSPLWRAGRDESHLLRFAFSYFAIVPFAAFALHRRRALRLDALVTIVALVWGAKLVVSTVLYQTVAPPRRASLHAPDPNANAPVAANTATPVTDAAGDRSSLVGRVTERAQPVRGAIVAVCDASPNDAAVPIDRPASITSSSLVPLLVDAKLGDRLTLVDADGAPHAVRGTVLGVSALSLAVVPGHASAAALTTLGTIALEVDGRPAGSVVVFDHSLHTGTDSDGRFRLSDVPVGPRSLCVYVGSPPVMHQFPGVAGQNTEETFDIGSAS